MSLSNRPVVLNNLMYLYKKLSEPYIYCLREILPEVFVFPLWFESVGLYSMKNEENTLIDDDVMKTSMDVS